MDINDVIRIARAHGSHWFDAAALRFFRGRVLPTVYEGPGGIFFVSSEQYSDQTPRRYTVRKFKPEDGDVDTVGAFNELTKLEAVKLARRCAAEVIEPSAPHEVTTTEAAPMLPTGEDDFVRALRAEGVEEPERLARTLRRLAARHHRNQERRCNGDYPFNGDLECPCGDMVHRLTGGLCDDCRNEAAITAACKPWGIVPIFGGDPRGCTVKLKVPSGRTDDWGREGLCVPIAA